LLCKVCVISQNYVEHTDTMIERSYIAEELIDGVSYLMWHTATRLEDHR